jgi:hypothetical protein
MWRMFKPNNVLVFEPYEKISTQKKALSGKEFSVLWAHGVIFVRLLLIYSSFSSKKVV